VRLFIFILVFVPVISFSQVDTSYVTSEKEYQVLREEGAGILTMGIALSVTSLGMLFSGPVTDPGVGTLFFTQQFFGLTLDVVGVVKLIRAKKKRTLIK
jgi:uncharacterized membrane protein